MSLYKSPLEQLLQGSYTRKQVEEKCKQECIAFLKWYVGKSLNFLNYLTNIKPQVTSQEIEEKLKEFEGQDFEQLHSLYLKDKEGK